MLMLWLSLYGAIAPVVIMNAHEGGCRCRWTLIPSLSIRVFQDVPLSGLRCQPDAMKHLWDSQRWRPRARGLLNAPSAKHPASLPSPLTMF